MMLLFPMSMLDCFQIKWQDETKNVKPLVTKPIYKIEIDTYLNIKTRF